MSEIGVPAGADPWHDHRSAPSGGDQRRISRRSWAADSSRISLTRGSKTSLELGEQIEHPGPGALQLVGRVVDGAALSDADGGERGGRAPGPLPFGAGGGADTRLDLLPIRVQLVEDALGEFVALRSDVEADPGSALPQRDLVAYAGVDGGAEQSIEVAEVLHGLVGKASPDQLVDQRPEEVVVLLGRARTSRTAPACGPGATRRGTRPCGSGPRACRPACGRPRP